MFQHVWHLVIAGNCNRAKGSNQYNDGTGTNAHMVFPVHGYVTKDDNFLLFVDMHSCARKLNLNNYQVTTVIGEKILGHKTNLYILL